MVGPDFSSLLDLRRPPGFRLEGEINGEPFPSQTNPAPPLLPALGVGGVEWTQFV
jgi:hypothetical protein